MRIPLSWLAEFVQLPENSTPESVHEALVSVGFEEEAIHRFDVTGPVVVGEVLELEPETHSNGKTVNWCQVRVAPEGHVAADGGADVRGIVCGAHNFSAGDSVVVALPGAVLPGGFAISARKTYGHISDGMIASQRELGIGEDHDGIIVLSRFGLDAPVGTPATEVLGIDDTAVEINVTPDRGYAFSVRGVAREFTHATGQAFTDPVAELDRAAAEIRPSGFSVTLADEAPIRGKAGVTGIVTRLVTGVDQSRPTPQWMVARLVLAGQRPLGLAADISNYVMLELGNPIHTYDADRFVGGMTVRRAKTGETLRTLDGQDRTLDGEDLVIADESGAVGIAGVMGGESTKITDATTNILIEAATFDPVSIARSARRHKLPSEASKRFERGVDPLLSRAAAQRVVDLLVAYGGGTATTTGFESIAPWDPQAVTLPAGFVTKLVGVEYSESDVRSALEQIGCRVHSGDDGALLVTPPSWRRDLTRKQDLAEEVARIHGYDAIPSVLPVAPAGRGFTREQRLRREAAEHLTSAGFTEVQNYPFVSQAQLDAFDGEADGAARRAVKLQNPLDGSAPYLRRSLLPGLVAAAQRNVSRGLLDLALVEFGAVFVPGSPPSAHDVPEVAVQPSDELLQTMMASLPHQPRHAAALLLGQRVVAQPGATAEAVDWSDALDAAQHLAWSMAAELEIVQGTHPAFHPGRTAVLRVRGTDVGVAGELLPELVADAHLPGRAMAFELDLDALIAAAPVRPTVRPLSTFPAATQDLTLLVDREVPVSEVAAAVREGAGELLESLRLTADYRGPGVDAAQRALTFALRFRATDRTLKAEEANEAKRHGVAEAERRVGAKLRE